MDVEKWLRGEYTVAEKEFVVAWYRINRAISAHVNEAQAEEAKKK